MDDDDSYLYGDSTEDVKPAAVQTTVPQPISLETTRSVSQGLVAKLEEQAAEATADEDGEEEEQPAENGGDEEDDDDDDSDEDVEIIMEEPQSRRTLDLRPTKPATRSTSQTLSTPQRAPQPSLTTEYTPRERGTLTKQSSSTPQPASQAQTPLPPVAATPGTTEKLAAEGEKQESKDAGPDPNTLPPATAPPSHPSINPSAPGIFDGRSILELDLNALADKPWRRPGSDISDWFNYGFDEISWEAYCYRRRELSDLAGMLKNNVVNFAGISEDQLIALPPEVRAMVMAGATTVMAGGGGGGGGMMPPGAGMNMNGGQMMNQMMNMGGMMNPMMEMGVGMGDMGMMQEGGGGGGGGPQGGGQGPSEGQVGMGMGVGEGFGPGGGPQGQGMMGMGMNPEFGMQDPSGMGQQMYPGMEGNSTPTPIPTGPSRGLAHRGRGMQQGLGMRGRGAGFAGRGRGVPVRPASPLPPNVPTGPRNKNKYKDIDGSAPAVDGLDYGGGGGGGADKDRSDRSERSERDHKDRKAGGTPDVDERDSRSRKRRGSPGEREESSRSSKRR
ncbi:hypothetical protein K466DRAFT_6949 [Polyporus arcularius HHB13444]|uniref:Pre-mRNA polyadenylation factor Fip1 domain-containing protein n=1 Tax=Polyporus arcularius HHB13444 TaxID=1314778 RepID=A0A5C3PKQ7_9APHY|nr:hypothetical protein K466DRAFT_6949 [Polyporus arcularius HHB13444]